MKKINQKILSLPPYISTSWKNINTLHIKEINGVPTLVVVLHNGSSIEIPHLEPTTLDQVFTAHSKFLEESSEEPSESLKPLSPQKNADFPFSIGLPFSLGENGNSIDQFGAFLHHNSEQANSPDLPKEVLEKIAAISKSLGMEFDHMNIPKAEPHCNCTYCQIARAIQNGEATQSEPIEEVSDEDLTFRDWDIKQVSDKLYEVTNPLEQSEHYQVFLGNPVGCTCGEKNCEHIRTVLNS